MGDVQDNHNLTGMYGNFTEINHVNHSCNCPWVQTDDKIFKCIFVKQSKIKQLCDKGDVIGLNVLYQHNIKNAFDTNETGYHLAGINVIMPLEILH